MRVEVGNIMIRTRKAFYDDERLADFFLKLIKPLMLIWKSSAVCKVCKKSRVGSPLTFPSGRVIGSKYCKKCEDDIVFLRGEVKRIESKA